MKSGWKCHCGKLRRLKFRGVRCVICRTECTAKQESELAMQSEMSAWMADDYRNIGLGNAVRLTVHTMGLVSQMKALHE